jgi:hypothetical protein
VVGCVSKLAAAQPDEVVALGGDQMRVQIFGKPSVRVLSSRRGTLRIHRRVLPALNRTGKHTCRMLHRGNCCRYAARARRARAV